ncbi:MAG TPA: hypothetical protein PKY81_11095 [bacterium]|nr:hypothetical protein [bacterium]
MKTKLILVVGQRLFKYGFENIFPDKDKNDYIDESDWKKKGLVRKLILASKYRIIHYYWGSKVRLPEILFLKMLGVKPIIHFIGTDVIHISRRKRKILRHKIFDFLKVKRVAVNSALCEELKTLNLKAEPVYFLNRILTGSETPLPEKFSVLCYVPSGREKFFRLNWIFYAAEKLPDVLFTILPNNNKSSLPNIKFIDKVPYERFIELIQNHSIFVRIPQHDGEPQSRLETLSCSRKMIWSFSDAFTETVNNQDELVDKIKKLKKENSLNLEGKKYVMEKYSFDKIRLQFFKLWEL